MTDPTGKHAIDGLFAETPEGPRLLGSRCATCATPYFPRSALCHNPECAGSRMEDAALGASGKLWSVAIQNYPPPPPARYDEPYQPYALGLIDTADGLRVLAQIATDDPQSLTVGCDVKLVLAPLYREKDGSSIITWKYQPVA